MHDIVLLLVVWHWNMCHCAVTNSPTLKNVALWGDLWHTIDVWHCIIIYDMVLAYMVLHYHLWHGIEQVELDSYMCHSIGMTLYFYLLHRINIVILSTVICGMALYIWHCTVTCGMVLNKWNCRYLRHVMAPVFVALNCHLRHGTDVCCIVLLLVGRYWYLWHCMVTCGMALIFMALYCY